MKSVQLGDVAKFIRGITFKPDDKVEPFSDGSVVCFRTSNVQSTLNEQDVIAVPSKFVKRQEQFTQAGDILVSTANSWELVGKCSWIPELTYQATIGGFISALRANPKAVLPRYLYHWFNSSEIQLKARNCGRQTTNISNMDIKRCLQIEIHLPPLEHQKHIAKVLDKADELRAKRRRAIAKLDELLKSVFLELFTTDEAKSWDTVSVESLAAEGKNKIRTGPFGSQLLHSEFSKDASGVLVLGIDNAVKNRFEWGEPRFIAYDKYQELKRYTVYPGDVLITIMGTCGRVAIVPDDIPLAINTKHLCCITLNPTLCLPIYLKNCFSMHPKAVRQLSNSTRGAIMEGLNMGIIKNLKIPLAPLSLQEKFCHFERQIERQKLRFTVSSDKYNRLFSSLQARAFSGDLTPDVLEEVEEAEAGAVQGALF